MRYFLKTRAAVVLAGVFCLATLAGAQINPDLYSGLQWRSIGPYHGGRVAAVSGAIGSPSTVGTFYAGLPQGGIWKTTSAGTTWFPVFDSNHSVDSIGSIAVAPSNPDIIYAGSGDAVANDATGTYGDGMYKSTDGGKTWVHIGLEGTRRIPSIVIDPTNPDIVVVAALAGDTGNQRGIFRTEDGGQTWQNVLHPDDRTGGRDLSSPFDMPNVIFATTIDDSPGGGRGGGFGGFGGRGGAPQGPTYTRLYKSLDEGKTWTQVDSNPETNGRICVAVAMHTNAQRVFVYGSGGLYRSDDQGSTWRHMADDDREDNARVRGSGYTTGVWVDTQNPDVVYAFSTAAYRSTDGGATFIAFKGAPGGEDFHEMWIDPTNHERMLMGTDQGAPVSLDGGTTWSSYYALPVAQVYHIATDDRYPYWVLTSQQDTGAVMIRSRGNNGDINETDWLQLASSEAGTITPDPIDPNIIYGVGYGTEQGPGTIKINVATGQWDNINPEFGAEATLYGGASRDEWRRFDPFDPHTLYTDFSCLVVSHDRGQTWSAFSPSLTTTRQEPQQKCGTAPPPSAATAGRGRGGRGGGTPYINDFAISTVRKGVFWTVSNNGQIFNSMDGGSTWNNVSNITGAPEGAQFLVIEAGHSDVNTAYISAHAGGNNLLSEANNVPLIWRTHDGGKTWTEIVNGLPSGQPTGSWVNVVREDPKQKGLLFAGTESGAYVSFDDGDHWQSLQNNLPTTSIRDMVFHTDDHMSDLVIGTYGRGLWVLDDTTPLRELVTNAQAIAAAPAYLFKPGDAIRSRISDNWDQPWNYELPWSPNPPFGVIFYYYLSRPPQGEVKLQVYDAANHLIRTISSIPPQEPSSWPYPRYWVARPQDLALPTQVGMNRFNWDLRYDAPPAFEIDQENLADVAPGQRLTPAPHGILAIPGTYTLKLIVDGQTYSRTVILRNDPRVGESPRIMAGIEQKHGIMLAASNLATQSYSGNGEVVAVRDQLTALSRSNPPADVTQQASELAAKLATFGGTTGGGRGGGRGRGGALPPGAIEPFTGLNNSFVAVVSLQENGDDDPPTPAVIDTYVTDCKNYDTTVSAWKNVETHDLVQFNALLSRDHLPPLVVAPSTLTEPSCTAPPLATAATPAQH